MHHAATPLPAHPVQYGSCPSRRRQTEREQGTNHLHPTRLEIGGVCRYTAVMIEALKEVISKIGDLPEEKQQLAADLLQDLVAAGDPYILSETERAILLPALERARRGEFASDADVESLWHKCGL